MRKFLFLFLGCLSVWNTSGDNLTERINRTEAGSPVLKTLSPYGRFRGLSAAADKNKRYPEFALDRKGGWTAIRFGNAGEFIDTGTILETGKTFTLETWIFLYDPGKYFSGLLIDAGHGYKTGFRLTASRAKWAPDGVIHLICGDGKKSKGFFTFQTVLNHWVHFVLVGSNTAPALYINGVCVSAKNMEKIPEKFFFQAGTHLFFGGSPRGSCDFKTDFLEITPRVMDGEEIRRRYEAGRAPANIEREKLFSDIRMEIPRKTQGYFQIGKSIPVSVATPAELGADRIRINGKNYKPGTKIEINFSKIGPNQIDIAVFAGEKLLRSKTYPVAIVPAPKDFSVSGSNSISERTPAAYALGSRLSREVINWKTIEAKKGEYDWTVPDRIMEHNAAHGVETVFCLTGLPYWAKIPRDLPRYRKLWEIIFARYDLKYAEAWSARSSGVCRPADFEKMLAVLHETAKKEKIKVLAGNALNNTKKNKKLLESLSALFDIVSIEHQAGEPRPELYGGKEVWVTSGGCSQTAANEKTSAIREIRSMLQCFAAGAKVWIAAEGPDEYKPYPNTLDGRPGWKGTAYAVLHSMIGRNAVFHTVPSNSGECFRYENPDGSSGLIVFPGKTSFRSPADGIDLFGKNIKSGEDISGKEPILFSGDVERQLQKGCPLR